LYINNQYLNLTSIIKNFQDFEKSKIYFISSEKTEEIPSFILPVFRHTQCLLKGSFLIIFFFFVQFFSLYNNNKEDGGWCRERWKW
jgi:hypothetical protein